MMEKQKKLEPALALARFSISWDADSRAHLDETLLGVIGLYLTVGSTDNDLFPHAQVLGKGKCEEAEHPALPVVPTCAAWVHRHGCESDDRDIDKVRRTLEKPRLDRVPAGAVTMSMQALPTACEYGVKDDNPGSELESNG
ncbi:hypothetical protein BDR05DRAFT_171633 [Suillus weaverae]|nr:hypothetical protein BDR05DRAFT_171633 [Suillus weaverae]